MKIIYKLCKRYFFFISMLCLTIVVFFIDNNIGLKAFSIANDSFLQMLGVIPPIMLMLGLMDVWIPRDILIKYMGDKSGLLGIFLAMLIGSLAAGPMYAAFPFTAVLMKKGVKFSNIIIFMNAWCVTKISTLLFEISALGFKFT
ncbi:MAG: permease, partial [Peptostreptococcaceae bacterium]|nr:permease [Peptostreptococcaceae bacterium]